MRSKPKMKCPRTQRILRFPRLMTGAEARAFEKLLHSSHNPRFDVKLKKRPASIEFLFRYDAPTNLMSLYGPLKSIFFVNSAELFEKNLARSYWKTASGNKPASQFISMLLCVVIQKAIRATLESMWREIPEKAKEQISDYDLHVTRPQGQHSIVSLPRRGQHPDSLQALCTFQRFQRLKKCVSDLRRSYKKSTLNRQLMWSRAEKVAPHDVICRALKKLVADETNIDVVFVGKRVSKEQIARAILEVELSDSRNATAKRPITLDNYLNIGEKLHLFLAAVPRPLRSAPNRN